MAHIFYDTCFNLEKYLDHEQRDPFAVQKVTVYGATKQCELSPMKQNAFVSSLRQGMCFEQQSYI